jgi:hypothetical protein
MIEVVKKRGIDKPRLVHNKKLFWTIIVLGIILIILIILIVITGKNRGINNNNSDNNSTNECNNDSDCVPVCGCHPDSCIAFNKKTECERMFCTQECSGPLDCGAGYCSCKNSRCSVINNNVK